MKRSNLMKISDFVEFPLSLQYATTRRFLTENQFDWEMTKRWVHTGIVRENSNLIA